MRNPHIIEQARHDVGTARDIVVGGLTVGAATLGAPAAVVTGAVDVVGATAGAVAGHTLPSASPERTGEGMPSKQVPATVGISRRTMAIDFNRLGRT